MDKYLPVIGLEIHVELKTLSKMFCQCSGDYFGKSPNSQVCPVCLGLPGALPVPNKKAVEWTILLGKALNCQINSLSKFDRKHYFYPDLPKGYQISQYDEPLAKQGKFSKKKAVRINRVHLEEDTGKLIHQGNDTLIDFNRSGVPLVEIVTEPDFDNVDDVIRFLQELQVIIRYLDVSDADMEKGTMRLEPNISIKHVACNIKQDNKLPNYKVEIKNINSFRFVKQAIEYEIKRQTALLENNKTPKQETRGFDEKKQITFPQRSKEEAHDYRYFPEPDIPPLHFSDEYLNKIFKEIPELPAEKVKRYIKQYQLKEEDAFRITRNNKLAQFYEKAMSNVKCQMSKLNIKYDNLGQMIVNLIINKKISTDLTVEQFSDEVVKLFKPKQTDEKQLENLINQLIELNPKVVKDYKKGKKNAILFLVGKVMREMRGKVDAKVVIEKIKKQLL